MATFRFLLRYAALGAVGMLVTLTLMAALTAVAQAQDVTGRRFSNGDLLLVAGVETSPLPAGFFGTAQVCWALEDGTELGCTPQSAFLSIANSVFTTPELFATVTATSPAETPDVTLAAILRVPRAVAPGAVRVVASSVSAGGFSVANGSAIVYAAAEMPRPPILLEIVLDELEAFIERTRARILEEGLAGE